MLLSYFGQIIEISQRKKLIHGPVFHAGHAYANGQIQIDFFTH